MEDVKLQRQDLEVRAAEVQARAQRIEAQEASATEQRAALAQREVELRSLVDELTGIDAHTNDMLSQVQQERSQTERSAAEMEVCYLPPPSPSYQLFCTFTCTNLWGLHPRTMILTYTDMRAASCIQFCCT